MPDYTYNLAGDWRKSDSGTLERDYGSGWQVWAVPHAEEASYAWAGANSPLYTTALDRYRRGTTNPIDQGRFDNPGALGQSIIRGESSLSGDSGPENDLKQELAFYSPETKNTLGITVTPEQQSAIDRQLQLSSPAAQDARTPRDFWDKYGGAVAGGLAMFIPGMQAWGAGMIGGAVSGANEGGIENIVTGAAKGGAMGWVGGEIANGIGDLAGYQPGIADSIWSDSASGLSSWGTQAGIKAGTNYLTGAAKSGISNMFGGTPQGNTPTRNLSNMSSGGTTTAGGNMATSDGMNLQDLSNMLAPLLGMYSSNKQGNQTNAGFDRGVGMMTTPSPDQQYYRTELQKMFTDPSSFYEGEPYKAALGQGQQATERSLNAQGLGGSGRELAELQKYGQTFGWDQMMKQAGLFSNLSGIPNDSQSRAVGGAALINQGQKQADITGAMSGDVNKGIAGLLSGGLTGSNLGGTTLSSLLKKANEWNLGGSTGSTDWLTQSGSTTDISQLQDLLGQQDGFNWSGIEGIIGGSEQDMMLNDQWDWSW